MKKLIAYVVCVSSISLMPLQQSNANTLIVEARDLLKMQDDLRMLGEEIYKLQRIPRVPPGTVAAFAGEKDKVPFGWVLCDGRALKRNENRELFNTIGTAHGTGDGSTTFNVPDYRGYFLRGISYEKSSLRDPSADQRIAMSSGGNTGNKVGSIQPDSFKEHNHGSGNLKNSSTSVYVSGTASPNITSQQFTGTTSSNGYHSHSYRRPFNFDGTAQGGHHTRAIWKDHEPDGSSASASTSGNGNHSHSASITVSYPNYYFSTSSTVSPQIISGATSNNGATETRPKNANVNYIIKI